MALKIYTSLPPSMNRFDATGQNIGDAHYRSCLHSWRRNGFDIVTINSAAEPNVKFVDEFHIKRIDVTRDAKFICQKPLVYFSDFISAIERDADGPIVITNADIELDLSQADQLKIANIKPGTFICEHRVDYTDDSHATGAPYTPGFDLFVLHRDDLHLVSNCDLVFGMPWWDYFIPVTALAGGLTRPNLEAASSIRHYMHDERWSLDQQKYWARIYSNAVEKLADVPSHPIGLKTLIDRIEWVNARQSLFPYPRRHNFFKNLFNQTFQDSEYNFVLWLGVLSLRFIANPHEIRLSRLNLIRFLNRLPF